MSNETEKGAPPDGAPPANGDPNQDQDDGYTPVVDKNKTHKAPDTAVTHAIKNRGSNLIETSEFLITNVKLEFNLSKDTTAFNPRGKHLELMARVPFLWQAFVPVALLITAFTFSGTLRSGLRGIATSTPGYWLVFIQALRIGALGGIMKGIRGEITSGFVFWIGIPDFLFGVSALVVGWLLLRKDVGPRF